MVRMLAALGVVMALSAMVAQDAFADGAKAHTSRDQRIEAILGSLASQQAHGWRQDNVPLDELEAEVAQGQHIAVSCGTISSLGIRAAERAGYRARMVGAFTREQMNGFDDGHIMFEVRLNEGWTVVDLDNNRMAPPGTGISELVRDPRWVLIAHDSPYDKADLATDPNHDYDLYTYTHLKAWYRHVLGVPLIWANGVIWFHDAAQQARGLSLGHSWAGGKYWRTLNR
jgi:GAF domain-containing protein